MEDLLKDNGIRIQRVNCAEMFSCSIDHEGQRILRLTLGLDPKKEKFIMAQAYYFFTDRVVETQGKVVKFDAIDDRGIHGNIVRKAAMLVVPKEPIFRQCLSITPKAIARHFGVWVEVAEMALKQYGIIESFN